MNAIAPPIVAARSFAQSSDTIDQVNQAVETSQISGWDVVAAIAIMIGGYLAVFTQTPDDGEVCGADTVLVFDDGARQVVSGWGVLERLVQVAGEHVP